MVHNIYQMVSSFAELVISRLRVGQDMIVVIDIVLQIIFQSGEVDGSGDDSVDERHLVFCESSFVWYIPQSISCFRVFTYHRLILFLVYKLRRFTSRSTSLEAKCGAYFLHVASGAQEWQFHHKTGANAGAKIGRTDRQPSKFVVPGPGLEWST